MTLTHDWRVVHDKANDITQIYGGQPDDNGTPEYVLSVLIAPGGDELAAAEQIAAALRGEA